MPTINCDVMVLGAGPGGYASAFRLADLGAKVVLIEKHPSLGGVCLNVGCIPSKALLHVAKVIDDAKELASCGVTFAPPTLDVEKIVSWKDDVIGKLTGGLKLLASKRNVTVIQGHGSFQSPNSITVTSEGQETTTVNFKYAIIAAGSRPVELPFIPKDPRILDSTTALELKKTDGKLLIIGGGIIGLEMATVYHALGTEVSIVELGSQIMPTMDRDVVKPLYDHIKKRYANIMLETKVVAVKANSSGIEVRFEGKNAPEDLQRFDQVLVAVGRKPNGNLIDAQAASIFVDPQGFIPVDKQLRTNVEHIFAIGDIIGQPMLAHKAHSEGHIVAEIIHGKHYYSDPRCIPNVAYTDPEVAQTGLTESQAKAQGIDVGKAIFKWVASGRALAMGRTEGITKLLFDNNSQRIIGAAIVGSNAGDLISETSLAIEMGCDATDIALTIHPHPTLVESIGLAAEIFLGTITDLLPAKDKKDR